METLLTPRLELRPISLPLVVAVLEGRRRSDVEAMLGAELPWSWPGRALVEQAFRASLEAIVADPETRLWGDRLMITRDAPPRAVGSVVFHGRPKVDGVCEVAYGIEEMSQGRGYATEAVSACLEWALAQPECRVVEARTMRWHKASVHLLEKLGMSKREEQGDALVYEKRRPVTSQG
jgi:[ribosomal protein S5]-alanine N-acetyltransferase